MALRLLGSGSGYIELKAPASAGDNTLTLPTNNGSANTFLKTDGSGNLSWQSNLTFDGSDLSLRATKSNLIVAKTGLTVKANSDLHTSYDFIQLGAGGALASYSTETATADTQFIHNAYRSSGGTWKYRYADAAARLRVNSPSRTWVLESAGIGSANGDITFTEQLRIHSSGRITTGGITSDTASFSSIVTTGGSNSNGGIQVHYNSGAYGGGSMTTSNAAGGGLDFWTYTGNIGSEANFTKQLSIAHGGNVTVNDGDLVIGTSGHGIDFSATPNAGASASNIYEILDDYEEGYFTPNIQPVTSGSITWVGTADLLSYTKIGRIVHIKGMLEVDSVSSPTGITRGTLPFTQASLTDESERTSGVCIIVGTSIAAGSYALYPNGGTDSYLEPVRIGNSADIERDAGSYLGAGDKLYFSYTYQASA